MQYDREQYPARNMHNEDALYFSNLKIHNFDQVSDTENVCCYVIDDLNLSQTNRNGWISKKTEFVHAQQKTQKATYQCL